MGLEQRESVRWLPGSRGTASQQKARQMVQCIKGCPSCKEVIIGQRKGKGKAKVWRKVKRRRVPTWVEYGLTMLSGHDDVSDVRFVRISDGPCRQAYDDHQTRPWRASALSTPEPSSVLEMLERLHVFLFVFAGCACMYSGDCDGRLQGNQLLNLLPA